MQVIYFIQTHKNPEQIYRLIQTIKKSSPTSYILISHNFNSCNLDVTLFEDLPQVKVISSQRERGNFSLVQSYLDGIDWLFKHNVQFDWLLNITGQDYPTQPLAKIEKLLAQTKYDAFLHYFDALSNSKTNYWGIKEGCNRYLYEYWQLSGELSLWQRALIKLPRIVINNVQPYIRIQSFCGLMVGIRSNSYPFNQNFLCYGGCYLATLSRKCVEYLYEFSKQKPEVINYYKKTIFSDESLIVTILVNSGLFNICNDYKRYMDWTDTRQGHPRILTVKHYPIITNDNIHFARKFDVNYDSRILDMLDARVLQGS